MIGFIKINCRGEKIMKIKKFNKDEDYDRVINFF